MKQKNLCSAVMPVLCALFVLVMSGCGDSGSGPSPTREGRFLDSPVEGLSFLSGQQSGTTDSQGVFVYEAGKSVSFGIGDIVIGDGPGMAVMTPVELVQEADDESHPTVTNITRLLLTLDDDADGTARITITEAVRAAASGMSIDFAQSTTAFGNDPAVQAAVAGLTPLTSSGARPLVSSEEARDHLRATLLSIMAGEYSGTFKGDDTGTWSITVNASGQISGSGQGTHAGSFSIWGSVTSGGSVDLLAGGVSVDASFAGTIARDGSVSGTWWGNNDSTNGTFSGNRQ